MYRRYHRKPEPRAMAVKYAGTCHCCGGAIKTGELATYYPPGTIANQTKGVIAHIGGLDGNSARCAANIKSARDPGYVDPGELAADRWNELVR